MTLEVFGLQSRHSLCAYTINCNPCGNKPQIYKGRWFASERGTLSCCCYKESSYSCLPHLENAHSLQRGSTCICLQKILRPLKKDRDFLPIINCKDQPSSACLTQHPARLNWHRLIGVSVLQAVPEQVLWLLPNLLQAHLPSLISICFRAPKQLHCSPGRHRKLGSIRLCTMYS